MNKGVATLMNFGVFSSRWGLSRPPSARQRAEMRGLNGVMNLEFINGQTGGWHVRFADGRTSMGKGLAENPRATVRVRPHDYLGIVAGDLSYSVARMTGRVRVTGDGNFAFVFGAFVEQTRTARSAPGWRGWVSRTLIRRALKKGEYQPKLKPA